MPLRRGQLLWVLVLKKMYNRLFRLYEGCIYVDVLVSVLCMVLRDKPVYYTIVSYLSTISLHFCM